MPPQEEEEEAEEGLKLAEEDYIGAQVAATDARGASLGSAFVAADVQTVSLSLYMYICVCV